MTFGYDASVTKLFGQSSSNTLRDHGRTLCSDLAMLRLRTNSVSVLYGSWISRLSKRLPNCWNDCIAKVLQNGRDLLFIAHSLGGLVCEQVFISHSLHGFLSVWRKLIGPFDIFRCSGRLLSSDNRMHSWHNVHGHPSRRRRYCKIGIDSWEPCRVGKAGELGYCWRSKARFGGSCRPTARIP